MLFARDLLYDAGYVAVAFIALALVVVTLTKPRQAAASSI
jgi:DHA1 family inner membrane transport protein